MTVVCNSSSWATTATATYIFIPTVHEPVAYRIWVRTKRGRLLLRRALATRDSADALVAFLERAGLDAWWTTRGVG